MNLTHLSNDNHEVYLRVFDPATKRRFKVVVTLDKLKTCCDQAARNKTKISREANGGLVVTYVGDAI